MTTAARDLLSAFASLPAGDRRDLLAEMLDAPADAGGLPLPAARPPLRVDPGGAVRVGRSRVGLDVVVGQYEGGQSPEAIVLAYDTLVLADVHAVIAYYLRHRDAVRAYLGRRAGEADAQRARVEAEQPRLTRAALESRRRAAEGGNAAARQ